HWIVCNQRHARNVHSLAISATLTSPIIGKSNVPPLPGYIPRYGSAISYGLGRILACAIVEASWSSRPVAWQPDAGQWCHHRPAKA
ncbi:MAG: hypothetical protein WBW73_24165, partial [Rhodoplanes sp.]